MSAGHDEHESPSSTFGGDGAGGFSIGEVVTGDCAYVGEHAAPFRWVEDDSPEPAPPARPPLDLGWDGPERDETGPGTLRPKAPEPVLAARTTSPSRAHMTVSRLRALIGLVTVVVLSGVVLAAAIGVAMLLITLVLSKAFGSG